MTEQKESAEQNEIDAVALTNFSSMEHGNVTKGEKIKVKARVMPVWIKRKLVKPADEEADSGDKKPAAKKKAAAKKKSRKADASE